MTIHRTTIRHPTEDQFLVVCTTKHHVMRETSRGAKKLGYVVDETTDPLTNFETSEDALHVVQKLMPIHTTE